MELNLLIILLNIFFGKKKSKSFSMYEKTEDIFFTENMEFLDLKCKCIFCDISEIEMGIQKRKNEIKIKVVNELEYSNLLFILKFINLTRNILNYLINIICKTYNITNIFCNDFNEVIKKIILKIGKDNNVLDTLIKIEKNDYFFGYEFNDYLDYFNNF